MKYFYIIPSIFGLIPFLIGLIKLNKLPNNVKIIFYLTFAGFIFNLLLIYFGLVFKKNVWLVHIYTILEFFLIALFFYKSFELKIFKNIIKVLIVIFTIVVIINKIYFEDLNKIDSYSLTISSILLLIVSSMFLVDYLTKNLIIEFKDYRFILTVGFMIYFGGDLFIFALSNDVPGIWIVHNIFSILLMLVYSLVFLWQK